jgi:Co/Zn/Cd efflux system component
VWDNSRPIIPNFEKEVVCHTPLTAKTPVITPSIRERTHERQSLRSWSGVFGQQGGAEQCKNGRRNMAGNDHSHGHSHNERSALLPPVPPAAIVAAPNHSRRAELEVLASRKQAEAAAAARKLKKATLFVLAFFVVELVGGIMAGSLAILTDAAHLLTDVSSFILAIIANEIASRPACEKLTYGPVRAEVLSALFSTVFILMLSVVLVYEAVMRIIGEQRSRRCKSNSYFRPRTNRCAFACAHQEACLLRAASQSACSRGEGGEVDGRLMSIIAGVGLLVNIMLLFILGDEHSHGSGFGGHDHSHGHAHATPAPVEVSHDPHCSSRCVQQRSCDLVQYIPKCFIATRAAAVIKMRRAALLSFFANDAYRHWIGRFMLPHVCCLMQAGHHTPSQGGHASHDHSHEHDHGHDHEHDDHDVERGGHGSMAGHGKHADAKVDGIYAPWLPIC